jgi:predicted PurR-regulated permease PerM
MPRGLIVVLGGTGLLVGVLALRQFASIIGPVLLALILVVGVHPLPRCCADEVRRCGWRRPSP